MYRFKDTMRKAIGALGALLVLALALVARPAHLRADTGGCTDQLFQSGYFIEDNKRVFDEEKFQVFVVKMGAAVYTASAAGQPNGKVLSFDKKFRVVDPGEGTERVKLKAIGDEEVGWVDRDALLCRLFPLKETSSGLLRRMVVQTETAVQNQVQPRLAYHSPQGQCEGGQASCPKLSRFQWYFVYAEENGHVLLADLSNLGGRDAHLVGWLPLADGISWNSAIALRPSEEVAQRKAPDGKNEAHVCAYPSINSMKQPAACRPILGGMRWFKIETRLPMLQKIGSVYEVAVSSAATMGSFEEALSLGGVDALKNLDVFFVVDGTGSMKSIIDAIKGKPGYPGIVDQIRTRMRGKIKAGGQLRFGYRIYRDSVRGGATGVEDEGYALPEECTGNEDKFISSFQSVTARDTPGDTDYPENVFGGLIQASRDFESCPNHLKLIVVIGDHGYDANAQRGRGHKAYDTDTVVQRFLRGRRLNTQPIVVVLQTPDDGSNAKSPESYKQAYETFRSQGQALLKGIYAPMQTSGASVNPDDFWFTLNSRDQDKAVVDRIASRVDQLLQPDVVGQLLTRLKGGESLADAVESMRRGDKSNVPILYWNVVSDALCKRLGSQCTKTVLEGVFRAYVSESPDLTFDVLMSQRQLEDWRDLLGKFKAFWSSLRAGDRSRAQLVNVLTESIGAVIKTPIDDSGLSLGEFAQLAAGLPHGTQSKLMSYTPAELRDANAIAQCEIQHLVNYATKHADIIQIIMDGDKLAVFNEEALPTSACPSLSAKGQKVPHLPGVARPRALNAADGSTDYRITFQKANDRYFWVPLGYLP